MAVILRDILAESRQRYHLELLAGENGLDRVMKWVYVSEDDSTADFLRGGELIITTGMSSGGSAQWLAHFLRRIIGQGTCGLVLNEGPYLTRSAVTPEIMRLCDEKRFPLLVMPWHVHIYDITRSYYRRIFADAQRDETVNRALRSLLDADTDHASALAVLPDCRFAANAPYYIAAFIAQKPCSKSITDDGSLLDRFIAVLARANWPWALVSREGELFLVCQSESLPAVQHAVQQLLETAEPNVCAGISGLAPGLEALARARVQAQAAARLAAHRGKQLSLYENMSYFKLLLEIEHTAVLDEYIEHMLGQILSYDARRNAQLTETLRCYLLCGGNLQQVAEAMFCHRNTVHRRIALLEQLLGRPLTDPLTRFELLSAFLAQEYRAVCLRPDGQPAK